MAVSGFFQEELDLVDASKSFTEVIDPTYGENEWSVDGWTVRAGSEASLAHGVSEAMKQMGFHWFTPYTASRPATLPASGITLPKQRFVIPYLNLLINYRFGAGRDGAVNVAFQRWVTLMCANDRRRPAGHAWQAIISENEDFFNANRSYWIDMRDNTNATVAESSGSVTFALDDPVARAACLDICVQYLSTRLNGYNRWQFDADDGDIWDSETFYAFCNDVVAKLRANHNQNAVLIVYAYAGHRAPPSFSIPHLGVQIATGFNDLGIGYQEMVRRYSLIAHEVFIRGYGDIAAWNGFLPCHSAISHADFFTSEYPGYLSNGVNGLNMETSTNWAINIVSHWHMVRYCRTGTSTYAEARDEVVAGAFGGDPAATRFFDILGDRTRRNDDFTMDALFQEVDQMQEGPRKTELQQYLTIMQDHLYITGSHLLAPTYARKPTEMSDDTYFSRLEAVLRTAQSLELTGGLHSYAYQRRYANSNVANNGRPDLRFNNAPHWQRFPRTPSVAEFETWRDTLRTQAARPDYVTYESLDDLALIDVAPRGEAALNLTVATDFYTRTPATFIVWNDTGRDITVTHTYDESFRGNNGDGADTRTFGPGVHKTSVFFDATTTWSGGLLFLDMSKGVRVDSSTSGHRWMYLPTTARGKYRLFSNNRLTVHAENGRFHISGTPEPGIQPGVARVDNTNTRGTHYFVNVNPFMGPRPDKMLMPKALAAREFPGMMFAT